MQNKLFFIFFTGIVFISFSCGKENIEKKMNNCICISFPVPQDTYIYPVRPGDAEWNLLTDGYQRIKACQLPDSLLKTISTSGLIETCIDHPLLFELIFSDLQGGGLQTATEKMIKSFNCLTELTERKDAGAGLLQRYTVMNPCCVESGLSEPGEFANSYSEYEMIFAQECFLEQLNQEELVKLLEKSLDTYNNKVKYDNYFSWIYGMNTSVFLLARCMIHLQYEPFIQEVEKSYYVKNFVNTCALTTNEQDYGTFFKKITDHAENLLM
ncbi:hypothetical protein GM418_22050 [Maribellus comscasis]|uniref:Uncharacterized protein n=1 Tax=Maribellus comscasis TaxID=2681766 RepID=A0A6I6JT80_9BACT|nr:hypothetical protein [Maribellus comscasis]QGY46246.1 hypothetical protein GM418_22050 [Maribellus comscasis]